MQAATFLAVTILASTERALSAHTDVPYGLISIPCAIAHPISVLAQSALSLVPRLCGWLRLNAPAIPSPFNEYWPRISLILITSQIATFAFDPFGYFHHHNVPFIT
jgi:hypothetical protein